jgi:hypothetical protein
MSATRAIYAEMDVRREKWRAIIGAAGTVRHKIPHTGRPVALLALQERRARRSLEAPATMARLLFRGVPVVPAATKRGEVTLAH